MEIGIEEWKALKINMSTIQQTALNSDTNINTGRSTKSRNDNGDIDLEEDATILSERVNNIFKILLLICEGIIFVLYVL